MFGGETPTSLCHGNHGYHLIILIHVSLCLNHWHPVSVPVVKSKLGHQITANTGQTNAGLPTVKGERNPN